MKITVATVCYNSADTIKKTMDSVLGQSYGDLEYIIVDGASTDETMSYVREYQKKYDIVVISEPDKGLYDAMNKAADMATGKYILYMNSGDIFASDTAVEKMVPFLEDRPELAYGNVIRCKRRGEVLETYHGSNIAMRLVLMGRMMCHQSIFTRTDIMKQYRFNLDFSITADYDFIVRLLHDKKRLKYVDVTVSKVDSVEGISSSVSNMDKMRQQDDASLRANFPILYYLVTPPKAVIRAVRRHQEKKLMK